MLLKKESSRYQTSRNSYNLTQLMRSYNLFATKLSLVDNKMVWHTIEYTSTDVSLHHMASKENQYNYPIT